MSLLYRSYSDLHNDLTAWAPKLPACSAVCGVPRSGVIVASQLAQILYKPLVPIEYLLQENFQVFRPSCSRKLPPIDRSLPVLLLDDTCSAGTTRKETEASLSRKAKVPYIYGAVYARPRAVELWPNLLHGYGLPERNHTFQWNLLRDSVTRTLAIDMDGILCYDWLGTEEEEKEGSKYEEWLSSAPPLRLPTYPVRAIFTNRLEKYRKQTEQWLQKHNVKYTHLEMYPGTFEQRRTDWISHKVRQFHRHRMSVSGFIESNFKQAQEIARQTGFSVIHMESGAAWNCKTIKPPIVLPQAQQSS